MIKKLLGAIIALTFAAPALGADIPTKAPSVVKSALFNGYPYTTSGVYFGINTLAGGGSVEATGLGVNPNSVQSNSAAIGATLGYVWSNGNVFYAVEGIFDWQNFNGSAPGFAFGGPATFEQRVKIGTPLANVLSMFPNLGLPAVPPFVPLPNGATATNIHPYLFGGVREDDVSLNFGLASNRGWRATPVFGTGLMGQFSQGLAGDTWVEIAPANSSICTANIGPIGCGKIGTQYRVGFGLYY